MGSAVRKTGWGRPGFKSQIFFLIPECPWASPVFFSVPWDNNHTYYLMSLLWGCKSWERHERASILPGTREALGKYLFRFSLCPTPAQPPRMQDQQLQALWKLQLPDLTCWSKTESIHFSLRVNAGIEVWFDFPLSQIKGPEDMSIF